MLRFIVDSVFYKEPAKKQYSDTLELNLHGILFHKGKYNPHGLVAFDYFVSVDGVYTQRSYGISDADYKDLIKNIVNGFQK